jgi:RimJ/RimL family protein N-acetyltransferase
MLLPIFETSRLLLRPRVTADTDACLAMDREPGVTRFVDGPWSDAAAHRAFIEARTRGPYPAGLGYWTILQRGGDASFLGWVLLIPLDAQGPEIEIGWRLRRAAWRQGIATEAAAAVLRYGLETLRLREVVADIDPANTASKRVAEKIGLRSVGVKRCHSRDTTRFATMPAAAIPI